jgi:hypothetical protein
MAAAVQMSAPYGGVALVVVTGPRSFSVCVGWVASTGFRLLFPSTPLLGSGAAPCIPLTEGDWAEVVAGWVMAGGLF